MVFQVTESSNRLVLEACGLFYFFPGGVSLKVSRSRKAAELSFECGRHGTFIFKDGGLQVQSLSIPGYVTSSP